MTKKLDRTSRPSSMPKEQLLAFRLKQAERALDMSNLENRRLRRLISRMHVSLENKQPVTVDDLITAFLFSEKPQ